MPNITEWTPGEVDQFTHKLEELIHGPGPSDIKIGFILVTFPVIDYSRASLYSNCLRPMIVRVLFELLKGLMPKADQT